MNDVVAYESLSKSSGTLRGVTHFPEPMSARSRALEVLRIARAGASSVGAGFANLRLDIERAWGAVMLLDCREALVIAERIEHHATRLPATVAKALRCELAALRAVAFVLQDDEAAALSVALSACGPEAGTPTAHVGLTVCRSVYWRLGSLERFHAVRRIALDGQPARMRAASVLFDLALDAAVALDQMRFAAARLLAGHALATGRRHAGTHTLADTFSACIVAQVLYEQGHVDEAEATLTERIGSIRTCCTVESALRSHGLLARIAANRGQQGRARVILNEAEALGVRRGWPRLRAASIAHLVELEVESGRLGHAENGLQRLAELVCEARSASPNVSFEIARFYTIARTRVALVRSPRDVDMNSLRRVHRDTVSRGGLYAAVPMALLMVEALLAAGQRCEAVEMLAGLLKLAPAAGLYQTFLDCSERVAAVIEDIVQHRVVSLVDIREQLGYAGMLLTNRQRRANGGSGDASALSDTNSASVPYTTRRPHAGAGLSERERLIVRMMGRGLSNKQIAGELRIAPETVKSHAKHLYAKLSVKNRTEAVTLATRLGLLETPRSLCV